MLPLVADIPCFYRCGIAASLLLRADNTRLAKVISAMNAYSETKCAEKRPADLVFPGEGI